MVGVARETVTRWRNDNPHFAAQLNRQRRLIWSDSHDRLRALASKAVDLWTQHFKTATPGPLWRC
jgi:hypothetical protein